MHFTWLVIIINHCKWRANILIPLSNAPPSLISIPKDFFGRSSKLRDQLLDVRNDRGLDSPEYELTLGTVLSELYQLVGECVIQRLGPIPATDDVNIKQYISDLYICSYTPSLSALIKSGSRNSHVSDWPSLLLKAQPDAYLPDAQAEIKVVQAVPVQMTSLTSENATSPAVVD